MPYQRTAGSATNVNTMGDNVKLNLSTVRVMKYVWQSSRTLYFSDMDANYGFREYLAGGFEYERVTDAPEREDCFVPRNDGLTIRS